MWSTVLSQLLFTVVLSDLLLQTVVRSAGLVQEILSSTFVGVAALLHVAL